MVSREQVRYIATLARLRFTDDEEERLAGQMNDILGYVEKLDELDTSGVQPMSHVLDLHNVVREDVAETRISRDEALKNAPDADSVYIRAPKVIE
jgi:aspartyl-tRNA(Asn)/glutamyl-tRNA(Gln) amidotransferase subunit C